MSRSVHACLSLLVLSVLLVASTLADVNYAGSYECVSNSCGRCTPEPLEVTYISPSTYQLYRLSNTLIVTLEGGRFTYNGVTTGTYAIPYTMTGQFDPSGSLSLTIRLALVGSQQCYNTFQSKQPLGTLPPTTNAPSPTPTPSPPPPNNADDQPSENAILETLDLVVSNAELINASVGDGTKALPALGLLTAALLVSLAAVLF